MRGDWWTDNTGWNLLKGVEGDTDNPILLDDETVIEFLVRIPEAKAAFLRMMPNMLPVEQERLRRLYNCVVPPSSTMGDDNTRSDMFQHILNSRIPVRSLGGWAPWRAG